MTRRFIYIGIAVALIIISIYLNRRSLNIPSTILEIIAGALLLKGFEKQHKTKELKQSENSIIEKVKMALIEIKNRASETIEASEELALVTKQSGRIEEEISLAVSEIANNIMLQASLLQESAAITKELGSEVEQSLLNSEAMAIASQDLISAKDKGRETITSLNDTFLKNTEANEKVIGEVNFLIQNSNEISAISNSITSITKQINLLALNASIEAARAGDAGKGFAVVAQEVRKLAEQSAGSANQITSVVKVIQGNIKSLQGKIEESIEVNRKTGENVELSNSAFNNLEIASKELEENIEKVLFSLLEIENKKNDVVSNITNAAEMSQNIAAASEEASASTDEHKEDFARVSMVLEKYKEVSNRLKISILSDKEK